MSDDKITSSEPQPESQPPQDPPRPPDPAAVEYRSDPWRLQKEA
jgi:hypothetical protein